MGGATAVGLEVIDVDDSPELLERFGGKVPVVLSDDEGDVLLRGRCGGFRERLMMMRARCG